MITFRLGEMRYVVHRGHTVTTLPDGRVLNTPHDPQPGQAETASRLGYEATMRGVRALNRDHDVAHGLLADLLGLPASPALVAAAEGAEASELTGREEDAALALQAYARELGVDLVMLAERIGK